MSAQVVQQGETREPVPYRRGVSVRRLLRGAFLRFLPGSFLGTGALAAIFDLSARGGELVTLGAVAGLAAGMTLGFGAVLLAMGRWLYPDARPERGRSFLAGVLAPFATFVALAAGVDWASLPLLAVAMGGLSALGLFFAWLSPTPAEMRGAGSMDDRDGAA